MKNQPHLYLLLASMSRYRAQCLEKLKIPFVQWAPQLDESALLNESPFDLVVRLSKAKANAGLDFLRTTEQAGMDEVSHIIGSDQVLALGDLILGKPLTYDNARTQLKALSGQTAIFYTGLCVTSRQGETKTSVDQIEVDFRTLSERQIDRYLTLEQPFDCAGSFKSEQAGIMLCHRISGKDPNALIGLPLISLLSALESFGYEYP